MSAPFPPSTMRAWQYYTTKGGFVPNLKLNEVPVPLPKPREHLVQVIAVGLNPVDFKPAENGFISRFAIKKPATPGIDIAARIVTPAAGSPFKRGQLVMGAADKAPFAAGGLREFATVPEDSVTTIPEGLDPLHAATICVAGLTSYQSIVPKLKKGDKVFINGGSGGVGTFGIQLAKAAGLYVTTSCSTPNVELCKSLGADEVVAYKKGSVVEALKASGNRFDLVVDNVGSDWTLYWKAHEYTKPHAEYMMIAASPTLSYAWNAIKAAVLPSFLGGGRRKCSSFFPTANKADLELIANMIKEGKVKPIIDQTFAFEDVPAAFQKLKTGRARGKIMVNVAAEQTIKDA